ncbi:M23 family metallopeptidase [Bacteroides sp.]|uniref:M23 family metallopeptidase n=1 Tax=Bacteroides sp. TaxID=29523 RepID=UPI0026167E4C|nr:M23 family metallopeptidase [Bacteroides sp.]MDD3036738.1 M23 family metallopeptidase [Bacteroides sp.]
MKNTTLLLIAILFSISVKAQDKSSFSSMELNHIRVATPGLFSQNQSIYLHLDSLTEKDYVFPLAGGKVISAYGARKGHSGADIKTCAKDTIRCAFNGVVRMSKPYSAYGNVVVVRHANGLETIYSHNFKNLVQSGDKVKAGQPVGLTGRTGRATTEHLHFETRVNGQHFNPNIIFNLKDGTLRKGCIKCIKKGNGIVVKPNQDNDRIAQNNK